MTQRRQFLAGGFASLLMACSREPALAEPPVAASDEARALIAAARGQIGVTLGYDPAYVSLAYPGGDIDRAKGVCTDVVIRAYRDAFGLDLQRAVHEDMAGAFARYPQRWGLSRPDANIDHRRVPNLETFWTRQGARLDLPPDDQGWQPGDIFTSLVGGRLPHTGIVSDKCLPDGAPMVIHNIGGGAREEALGRAGEMTGRFRWKV